VRRAHPETNRLRIAIGARGAPYAWSKLNAESPCPNTADLESPGGSYFFTLALYDRVSAVLTDTPVRAAIIETRRTRPWSVDAWSDPQPDADGLKPVPEPVSLQLANRSIRTMATQVNIHEAKTHLSQLIERVEAGEEVVIARAGSPVARLVAVDARRPRRVLGALAGRTRIPADFNAPLPEDLIDAFEGR
jgi:prevent-host-death family protein